MPTINIKIELVSLPEYADNLINEARLDERSKVIGEMSGFVEILWTGGALNDKGYNYLKSQLNEMKTAV